MKNIKLNIILNSNAAPFQPDQSTVVWIWEKDRGKWDELTLDYFPFPSSFHFNLKSCTSSFSYFGVSHAKYKWGNWRRKISLHELWVDVLPHDLQSSKVWKLKLIKMETKPRVMLISVITYCLFVRSLTQAQNSYLTVKDGVYSKLTVAIRPSVPAKNCPQFLDNVEVRPAQFLLTFSDCNRKDRRR